MPPDHDHRTAPPPRVWLLFGHKAGDNEQLRALADSLGWPYEIKHLVYRRTELITNRLLGVTLAGIVKSRSSPLRPPWPELIITAGRRNDPVAQWIRRQARGRVRLVRLGRPWAALEVFYLVVVTPQYPLPPHPRLIRNTLPLHRIDDHRLGRAAAEWGPRLAHLPRPYIAVLAGGNSGAYTLEPELADYMGHKAAEMAEAGGGSILVTTSPRTPKAAARRLIEAARRRPSFIYEWGSSEGPNPYLGYLALADELIVTGESISMLTEAYASGRPVHIVDLDPAGAAAHHGIPRPRFVTRLKRARIHPLIHRLGMWTGPRRLRRDLREVHRVLIEAGHAAYLGTGHPTAARTAPMDDDLETTMRHVRALFADSLPVRPTTRS